MLAFKPKRCFIATVTQCNCYIKFKRDYNESLTDICDFIGWSFNPCNLSSSLQSWIILFKSKFLKWFFFLQSWITTSMQYFRELSHTAPMPKTFGSVKFMDISLSALASLSCCYFQARTTHTSTRRLDQSTCDISSFFQPS